MIPARVSEERRKLLTALYLAAVKGTSPFSNTRSHVLRYLQAHPGLARGNIHIIALGKASYAMALGACSAVKECGSGRVYGVVVSAEGAATQSGAIQHAVPGGAMEPPELPETITLIHGDHPVPGPNSLKAADAIDDAVQMMDEGDLAIVLLSGGTTALAAAPVAELARAYGDDSRAQTQVANLADLLLDSGLAIHEMNAIRRRVLRWGAGRLAVALHKRGVSRIPVFAISDVIGDDPAVIGSGPCTADTSEPTDFLAHLAASGARGALDAEMERFLGLNGDSRPPTVPPASHPAFALVEYTIVAGNGDAVDTLAEAARSLGIDRVTTGEAPLEGSAAALGHHIASGMLRAADALPPEERALYVFGGEPTVDLRAMYRNAWDEKSEEDGDEPMKGGRMQLFALSAALLLHERDDAEDSSSAGRVSILAAGTDGRDGPTDAAGAIVDASVIPRARRRGRDPIRDAGTGRSWFSLDAAGALLRTGPTGTNVMDVVAVLIDRSVGQAGREP